MKTLRDTWLVFGRYLGLFLHNPVWVVIGVVQPLLYSLLPTPYSVGATMKPCLIYLSTWRRATRAG